jgi:hypothetical protein
MEANAKQFESVPGREKEEFYWNRLETSLLLSSLCSNFLWIETISALHNSLNEAFELCLFENNLMDDKLSFRLIV